MLDHVLGLYRVGYFAAPPSANVRPATIPDNVECIEILTAGVLYFEVDGVEREYRRGAVFWHLSDEKTIWKTLPQAPYCCVVFAFAVGERKRLPPRVSCWSHAEGAAEFAEQCLRLFHAGIEDLPAFTAYTYATLLWNSTRQAARLPWPAALQTAVDYIQQHWREPLDAAEVAEISHISKPYLFALFREHMKTSPHQYLLRQRIDRAKFMLSSSDVAIKEIAIACGFGSLEVFYRQFKRAVRATPQQYRLTLLPYSFREI